MGGESATIAQLANPLNGGMQAVKRFRETLADFGRPAQFGQQKQHALLLLGETAGQTVKTIPACEETANTQRFEEDSWLRDLDSNHD
jgi:hypothetical protein